MPGARRDCTFTAICVVQLSSPLQRPALAGVLAVSTMHSLDRFALEVMLDRLYGLHFIAVSEAGRLSAVRAGISADRIAMVHSGVDVERFNSNRMDRRTNRRAIGLDDASVLITMIAPLMREEAPVTLLDVARQLASSHPYAHFALVGTGALDAQVRRIARDQFNVTC
jgi:glycosyltransferase involved in cell wall biosynthesis